MWSFKKTRSATLRLLPCLPPTQTLVQVENIGLENVTVAMRGLLLLSYCSEETRIVAINMLRMAMCSADLQYTLPPSLFALARDLSIMIRGVSLRYTLPPSLFALVCDLSIMIKGVRGNCSPPLF